MLEYELPVIGINDKDRDLGNYYWRWIRHVGRLTGGVREAVAPFAHEMAPSQEECPGWGHFLAADSGTPGVTRTRDLLLRRQALYPLSYGRVREQSTNGSQLYRIANEPVPSYSRDSSTWYRVPP
jgi:hypothetical protein